MSSKRILLFPVIFVAAVNPGFCQGVFNSEYVPSSSLKGRDGGKHGSGDLLRLSARHSVQISREMDGGRLARAWVATVSAAYAIQGGKGEARDINPRRILNANLTLSHQRALPGRWSILASAGFGVYAPDNEIRWHSILANGSFIFAYRLRGNLSVGVGGGLTNSYGPPIVIPMGYLNWKTGGKYELTVDVANAPKIKVATQAGERLRMELTAIEMNGMTAVAKIRGKEKIYSSTMLKSGLAVSLRIGGNADIYGSVGGVWLRSVRLTDRNLRGFFKSFGSDGDRFRYRPSFNCGIGLRCGF